jgi:1-acyl-sn-glycerol-3-phosphate acyltransferase
VQDVKQPEQPQALQPASQASQTSRRSGSFRHWLSRLRAYLILDPLILSYTFVLGVIALIISFFDSTGRRQHTIARAWSKMIMATIFSPMTVVGAENLEGARAAVYAANHISAIDIPLLYALLPFQFRIIAKEELFRTPCVGWYLKRSGQLPVDRSNARASIRSLNKAVESLKAGMPLMIFPEGGRARDGHIMPFMDGPFYTAIKAGVDIVPMAIVGTFELLPMDGFHVQPRPLYLIIGKPISTVGYSLRDMEALAQQTQKVIEDMYYSRSTVPDPRVSQQA